MKRFDAESIVRIATLAEQGRLEIRLKDSAGEIHVLSLPLPAAIELGSLICDLSKGAHYLLGSHRQPT